MRKNADKSAGRWMTGRWCYHEAPSCGRSVEAKISQCCKAGQGIQLEGSKCVCPALSFAHSFHLQADLLQWASVNGDDILILPWKVPRLASFEMVCPFWGVVFGEWVCLFVQGAWKWIISVSRRITESVLSLINIELKYCCFLVDLIDFFFFLVSPSQPAFMLHRDYSFSSLLAYIPASQRSARALFLRFTLVASRTWKGNKNTILFICPSLMLPVVHPISFAGTCTYTQSWTMEPLCTEAGTVVLLL